MFDHFFKKNDKQDQAVESKAESREVNALLIRIQEMSQQQEKSNKKDAKATDIIAALALLTKILHEATPQPENDEVEQIPDWKRKEILMNWLVQCKLVNIDKPLQLLASYKSKSNKKESAPITWLADFFGKKQIEDMIDLERLDPDYILDHVRAHETRSSQIDIIRRDLPTESMHFMDFVIAATENYFSEEKIESKDDVSQEKVKNFVEAVQNYFIEPRGGLLARSFNEWPIKQVSEKLNDAVRLLESDLKNTLEKYDTLPAEMESEESTYLTRQVQIEMERTWGNIFDKVLYYIFDELFEPETGEIKPEIIAFLKNIQDHLPADSLGKQFSLTDGTHQKNMILGLAGTLFTNVYFLGLMEAPIRLRESLLKAGDAKKLTSFQSVNAAANRIFNRYNKMIDDTRLAAEGTTLSQRANDNVTLFNTKFDEWRQVRTSKTITVTAAQTVETPTARM